MHISCVFKSHLLIFCFLAIYSALVNSETVEVPEDAENYYSEDITDDELEPQITIIKRKDSVKEEYRLNGKLYMIKIIPSVGPSYFYIDENGDGVWDAKSTARETTPRVPQWVIFSW